MKETSADCCAHQSKGNFAVSNHQKSPIDWHEKRAGQCSGPTLHVWSPGIPVPDLDLFSWIN